VLLDGAHLLREALASRVRVDSVLVSSAYLEKAHPGDRALPADAASAGAIVYEVTPAVLAAATPVRTPSGIVSRASWAPAELHAIFASSPALAIGFVNVQDPGNLGGMIRSADAFGATGAIAIGDSAHPSNWKALRGAMGSTFRLPTARASMAETVGAARRAHVRVIATTAHEGRALGEIDWTESILLLVGNEGAGLPAEIVGAADERMTIPIRSRVNSLNVGVAAAVALYEAMRQRGGSS
jgi:TrmH family RNA methyltransferase